MRKTGMRKIVERGYDEGDYEGHYRLGRVLNERETRLFNRLLENVLQGGKILDLGSGTGIPYDSYLVERGYDVTGVDISGKHVEKASKNVPDAGFMKADFTDYDIGIESYDAIISMYSIFHVPREEHVALLKRIHRGLKLGGRVLVTLGRQTWKWMSPSSWARPWLGAPTPWSRILESLRRLASNSSL